MRIAISGCGVAGPTMAYWLRHYGHEAVLFEKSPALREGGYVIDFWGSGFKVADKMGIIPALREEAVQVTQIQSVNRLGKVTTSLGVEALQDMMDGDYFSVARSDLARHIYQACSQFGGETGGLEAHFGTTIEQAVDEGSHVAVTLSDGRSENFDLLIGADGLHSRTRELVFGAQDQFEKPMGLTVVAFMLDEYRPRTELAYVQYTCPDKQISRIALRDDKTLILMVFADHLLDEAPKSETAQKAALRDIFGGIGWEADAIQARLGEVEDLYFDRISQIEMPKWTKGRIALIGDAAGCASLLAGEGTGLAMTEAYVLAGELHRAGGDHVKAFAAYEALLQDYVAAKQKGARGFKGFFAPKSNLGLFMREMGMKLASVPFLTRYLLGAGLTDQITLPEYEN